MNVGCWSPDRSVGAVEAFSINDENIYVLHPNWGIYVVIREKLGESKERDTMSALVIMGSSLLPE